MIDLKEIAKYLKGGYLENYFYDKKENAFVKKENENTIKIIPLSKRELEEYDIQFISALNDDRLKEELNSLTHGDLLIRLKELKLFNDYEKYLDKLCMQIAKNLTSKYFEEDEINIRIDLIKAAHRLYTLNTTKNLPYNHPFVIARDNQELFFAFDKESDSLFIYVFSSLSDYINYYFKDDLIEHGASQDMVYSLLQYKSIVFFENVDSFNELLRWNKETGIDFKNSPYVGCFNKIKGETITQCSALDEALLLSFVNDLYACFIYENVKIKLDLDEAFKYTISDEEVTGEIVKLDYSVGFNLFPELCKDYHNFNLNVEEVEFKLDCKYDNNGTCKYFIVIEKNDAIVYYDQVIFENEESYLEMESHLYEHFLKCGVPEKINVSDIISFDYLKRKMDYVGYYIIDETSKLIIDIINRE